MYICLCRAVTSKTIRQAIAQGAVTVQQVGQWCRAGTVCRRCQPLIQEMIDEENRERQ